MSPSLTPDLGEQTVSLLACTARRDLGELVAREEGRWLGVRPGVLHMWTLGKKLARNFYLVENLEGVLALVAISIVILSICSSIIVFICCCCWVITPLMACGSQHQDFLDDQESQEGFVLRLPRP